MSIKIEGELECKKRSKNRRMKEKGIIIERNRKEKGIFIERNIVKIETWK